MILIGLAVMILATPSTFAKNLRMLSAYPDSFVFSECLDSFNNHLNRLSDGKLSTIFSGPDVIPTVEQFQPLQAGVFDMLFTIAPYHIGTTAVGAMIDTMTPDPAKRRQSGIFKYIDDHYKSLGVKVVAIMPVTDIHFLTRQPLEGRIPSFSGLKMRTTPTVVPLVKTFGGSPVNMAPGEVYTAMQKGVIDGAVMISYGAWNYKWHEVSKYMVRPFFSNLSAYIFMNLDKYNALSAKERASIDEAGRISEKENTEYFKNKKVAEMVKLKKYGLKETHMRPEDGKKLNRVFNETLWAIGIKKSGKAVTDLKELAVKKGMYQ